MPDILVNHVWKRFLLRRDRPDTVGQLLVKMLPGRRRPQVEPFWALSDVSVHMASGESLGVVGNNGSGKSTLLKILTRTMVPTSGSISVTGRISALIELGAGFHPDFTGRENAIINASILGISRREILKRMDDIIDFAEIRPFIDVPVKYYSSGMNARLGFAVAIHVMPEILIVDEVLAVGDESFQRKCMDRILDMKKSGVNILLVSHDLGSVERLMDRAIWLDHGRVQAEGKPADVIKAYRSGSPGEAAQDPCAEGAADRLRLRVAKASVRTLGRDEVATADDDLELSVVWENDGSRTVAGDMQLVFCRPDGLEVAEVSSHGHVPSLLFDQGRTAVKVRVGELHLVAGRYLVNATLTGAHGEVLASESGICELLVVNPRKSRGVVAVDATEWELSSRPC